ncbi:MAG: RNA polymerase sigma factor RpoD/SigA [Alphaproteobacteria bacterium]|nr:RNA polymerase sigma factor RpoD/SigA [Alphaproteobacteria bacterium]
MKSNIRLVAKFVFERRMRNRHDADDLVQMGLMGLMRAAEKFDPDYGCRFSTYASWWIRQGVHRGIANDARTIRVPVHILERISKFRRTRNALGLITDNSGTAVRKIAEALGWSDAFTARIAQIAEMRTVSLEDSVGPDQGITLADLVPDTKPGPEEIAISNDTFQSVRSIIEELNDDRLKDIITRRFGLDGTEETLQSIGESYGITRERIRQLEEKALGSLRRLAIKRRLGNSKGILR